MGNKKYNKNGIQVNVIHTSSRRTSNQGNNMSLEISEDNHPSSISQSNTVNTYSFNVFNGTRQVVNSQYGTITIESEA